MTEQELEYMASDFIAALDEQVLERHYSYQEFREQFFPNLTEQSIMPISAPIPMRDTTITVVVKNGYED